MAYATCYYMFLTSLLILIINPASSDRPTQALIERICREMEEFGFCSKTFNENLKSTSTDIIGLTQITIKQVLRNASNTHDFIVRLVQTTTDKAFRKALIECENGYHIVLQSFQQAYDEFKGGEYGSMLQLEYITPRAQSSCEINPETLPSPANPLIERNREMRILIAMAVVTGDILVASLPSGYKYKQSYSSF